MTESSISEAFRAWLLAPLTRQLKEIKMDQQTEAAALVALKASMDASIARIVQKITDLTAAVANSGNTTADVDAAVAALQAEGDALAAIVPAAPAP